MNDEYNPNSIDATLSRIEQKLTDSLKVQEEHCQAIRKLWAALGRLDVRVACISATATGAFLIIKYFLLK